MHNNQQPTVRGYLVAIKFFHKRYAGWDLPPLHCMIVAVRQGINRAHGALQKKAQVGQVAFDLGPLAQGRQVVISMVDGGKGDVVGAHVVVFPVMPSVGVVGVRDREDSPRICLTRDSLTFFCGGIQVVFENRSIADSVQGRFLSLIHI